VAAQKVTPLQVKVRDIILCSYTAKGN